MELVFATNNANKIKEVQALIPQHIKLLSLKDIGCYEELPETQNSIEGNARQKADYVTSRYNYDCFADDTGLEVDALKGAPGVYSARYAGAHCSSNDNMEKLLHKLKDIPLRKARFKTVIALNINQGTHMFTGICNGAITRTKKGTNGFGYDPIFRPYGFNETFAEMDIKLKNKISHRAKAINQLIEFLNTV
ncbi:non-canonical purine NTP diphosphatase [Aestuariivivens sediminicola]|uniref:non-canonical purine NTP diphosphatase n=1 Tax=Aestuariivivens sediminicola TaxID=2913560 RepID=UPI001F591C2E|nr:non-canonical purine NTP diphosphatase [Aestuariivivens sediminicola]